MCHALGVELYVASSSSPRPTVDGAMDQKGITSELCSNSGTYSNCCSSTSTVMLDYRLWADRPNTPRGEEGGGHRDGGGGGKRTSVRKVQRTNGVWKGAYWVGDVLQ